MVDEVLDYRYLFLHGTLPLPKKPFCAKREESTYSITKKLDALAEHMAAAYPDKQTGKLVRDMYFGGKNVTFKEGLIKEGMFASHRRSTGMYEPEHHVSLDASLEHCPILKRMFMIHEIAVHAAQFRERAISIRNRLGYVSLDMVDTPHYRHFTEMTAACMDKLLIDAIPPALLDQEIETIQNEEARQLLRQATANWRSFSASQFMRMKHRQNFADGYVSERELELFAARPEVMHFLNDSHPKSHAHARSAAGARSPR